MTESATADSDSFFQGTVGHGGISLQPIVSASHSHGRCCHLRPVKCTYLPTKTLSSGEAARLHTRLNALGLEPFSTAIKDHSTQIFYDSLNHDGSLRVYKHLR